VFASEHRFWWLTGAIGSSFWPYYGRPHSGLTISSRKPTEWPTFFTEPLRTKRESVSVQFNPRERFAC
jgi:hypothetical protein